MKTSVFSLLCCIALVSFPACETNKTFPGEVYRFDLQQMVKTGVAHEWVVSPEFGGKTLSIDIVNNDHELVLSPDSKGIDWVKANYFVCEVWHDNPYIVMLHLQLFRQTDEDLAVHTQGDEAVKKETGPRIEYVTGILPQLKTQLVMPLSYLDGQDIISTRQPRQLKAVVWGRRIEPTDIGKVSMTFHPAEAPDYLPRQIQIASAYLTTKPPKPYEKHATAVVDSFGQWTARDWPGKVHSIDELKTSMAKTESLAASAVFPDEWSAFGGWKQLRFKPKGFFYTHHDGRRWWLVDPDGYAFISAGVDCINNGESGVLSGQEDLFAWLPPKNDPLFANTYLERRNKTEVNFLKSNLIRMYGPLWQEKWEEITTGLMKQWRVNTVGNWSDSDMARRRKMPYVFNMVNFPSVPVKLYRDFPDVFDPAYQQASQRFAEQLEQIKNDPYLIGYFLQNEPHWAFGDNNLAFEMFATPTPAFTKKEMARWLQKKYGDILRFNEAWKLNLPDFDALETFTMKDKPSDTAWDDCYEFSGLMVDRYVETVCNEVKKVDPNHLNLGMRYAWISSELCYRAGAWFDVFSINGYSTPDPPRTDELSRRSGKPVLIGEWHFGCATDRGLPSTGVQGAESQLARGEAYRYYFEQGIARPEVIGIHWFQWNDQPVFGRFDGENCNIGFLDVCMQPYPELTNQAKRSHERMYRLSNGNEQPYGNVFRKVPQIF